MIPMGLSPHNMLVVVDFSWWLNMAFRVAGIDGMASIVIGKFAALLSGEPPAYLAAAVDSIGPTWRHELTEGLPEERQYKGHRDPKPPEFYALSNRILEIVKMHRIPIFYAEGWEADDGFAAAVWYARQEGLTTVMISADKDLGQLVSGSVYLWDGAQRLRGPAEIEADPKHPVPPAMLGDLLAIVGDTSDNVPGVPGLGPTKAAAVLRRYGSLHAALDAPLPADSADDIMALERALPKAKKAGLDVSAGRIELEKMRAERDVGKSLAKVQAHRADVELAKRLVTLDANAPIEWNLAELAIGGYDVAAIRKAYRSLGFTNLAEEVRHFPKEPPALEREAS